MRQVEHPVVEMHRLLCPGKDSFLPNYSSRLRCIAQHSKAGRMRQTALLSHGGQIRDDAKAISASHEATERYTGAHGATRLGEYEKLAMERPGL